jgi:hypothetical protein
VRMFLLGLIVLILLMIQLHEGSSIVREQKYHLVRAKYDEFKILPNECCNDIFSHFNLIVKKLNYAPSKAQV